MIYEAVAHTLIVYVYRLAFLDMHTSCKTVIRVKESGVDAGINLLSLCTLTLAKLREGLTDLEAVVVIRVSVRIRNDVICISCSKVESCACKIYLKDMHLAWHILPLIRSELKACCQFLCRCNLSLIIEVCIPVKHVCLRIESLEILILEGIII